MSVCLVVRWQGSITTQLELRLTLDELDLNDVTCGHGTIGYNHGVAEYKYVSLLDIASMKKHPLEKPTHDRCWCIWSITNSFINSYVIRKHYRTQSRVSLSRFSTLGSHSSTNWLNCLGHYHWLCIQIPKYSKIFEYLLSVNFGVKLSEKPESNLRSTYIFQ